MFNGCTALKTIELGSSVTEIPTNAFNGCTALTILSLTDSNVRTLGSSALQGCTALKRIELPETMESINGYAFVGCTSLEEVAVAGTKYVAEDNLVYTADKSTLLLCPPTRQKVEIPSGVTAIGEAAFYSNTNLTEVTMPDQSDCNRKKCILRLHRFDSSDSAGSGGRSGRICI